MFPYASQIKEYVIKKRSSDFAFNCKDASDLIALLQKRGKHLQNNSINTLKLVIYNRLFANL